MANTLLITKETGNYFSFVLNGNTANKVTSIKNDLLAVGEQLHFKTANGANIIKEQFIYPANLTVVSGGTFTFTTVAEVWTKLIEIGFFDWISAGGGSGASRFDDLLDTFKYTGKDGKAIIVNESQQKLEAVTIYNYKKFTELQDTPTTLVPNKMVVVNAAGTALELKDQPVTPPQYLNSVGYFDYNDAVTQTTPLTLVSNTAKKITNDTLGLFTNVDQPPYGVSSLWDSTTNQFNFSQLSIGDTIDVRIHLVVTTTTSNQKFHISAKFGVGSTSVFENIIYDTQIKTAGAHEVSFVAPFYIGSNDIKNNPAELYITTDASGSLKVNGFYIRVLRKNINIVSVETGVDDASASVKGILRLAGDLSGTATNPTVPGLANKVPTTRTITINGTALDLSADRSWNISATANWGGIGGTLSNQTDLQAALNAKQANLSGTGFVKSTAGTITYDTNTYATTTNLNDGLDTKENIIGAGTTAQYWRGDKTFQDLNKAAVGLGNVDNTTDAGKPISTATQTALDLKANDNAVVKLTGNQSISGSKIFNDNTIFEQDILIKQNDPIISMTGYTTIAAITNGLKIHDGGVRNASVILANTSSLRQYEFPDADGVFALTSNLSSYLPLTGGTLASSGSSNTLNINHSSGSGIALNISKNGNGEGLSIVKGSGSGNAASITGGITLLSELNLTTKLADAHINSAATWNAKQNALNGTGFVKASGTTISYDNTSYQPLLTNPTTGTGNTNYVTKWTGASTLGNSTIFDNGTNVGIGTASPLNKLHINDNSGIRISSPTNSNFRGIVFGANATDLTEYAFIKYIPSTGEMRYWANPSGFGGFTSFYSNAIESMRITSTGNVGIGTTSPSEKLEVNGNAKATSFIKSGGTSSQFLKADGSVDSNAYITGLSWDNLTGKPTTVAGFGIVNAVSNVSGVTGAWTGTQAAYDAITTKSNTTIYFIQ
jgi:hypothetical protein